MAVEGPKRGEAIELILCACSNSFYTKARGIEYREANPVTEVWRTWQRSSTDARIGSRWWVASEFAWVYLIA
jgi:hypothetical protein